MNFTSAGQISCLDPYRVVWFAFHEADKRGVNNEPEAQRTGSERGVMRRFHIYHDNDDSHAETIARSIDGNLAELLGTDYVDPRDYFN